MLEYLGEMFFDNGAMEHIITYRKTSELDFCILESGAIFYIEHPGTEKERILDNHYNDMTNKIDHIYLYEGAKVDVR